MKSRFFYAIIFIGLMIINGSCIKTTNSICEFETYISDIEKLKEKSQITNEEYESLRNYLSKPDTLNLVKGFTYKSILGRIRYNQFVQKELEEQKRIKQLSKLAFEDGDIKIYFGDTKEEVEKKIKDYFSSYGQRVKYLRENTIPIILYGLDLEVHFSYNKDIVDKKEHLDYYSFSQDIKYASSYSNYYVGETKRTYEYLIDLFEKRYGVTEHYYPDFSSYNSGYGSSFTLAEWKFGDVSADVEITARKYRGYYTYETRYVVSASVMYFDEELVSKRN